MGLDQHLVVGLVGSMLWSERHQMCYGWEIVEALQFLTDLPVKGLLVGDGDGRAVLEQRAAQLGVRDRILFTGQLPYQDLPDYLSLMDICVSTQSNDLVGQVRTTGKLPLYLAYGKYVIATNVGEAQRVLPGVGCLIDYSGVRDDCYPAQLAAQIRKLMDKPEVLQVQEQARTVAQENFAYDLLARRVEQICLRLCRQGSSD